VALSLTHKSVHLLTTTNIHVRPPLHSIPNQSTPINYTLPFHFLLKFRIYNCASVSCFSHNNGVPEDKLTSTSVLHFLAGCTIYLVPQMPVYLL